MHWTLAAHPASLDVLPTDFWAIYTCEAAISLQERAILRVLLANKEVRCTETLNHNRFGELILFRGGALTYLNPRDKLNRIQCDSRPLSLKRSNCSKRQFLLRLCIATFFSINGK